MSQRILIRNKIKEMLIAKTLCGNNVTQNRFHKWREEKLPAISIYTLSETSEVWNVAPREYKRKLAIAVEILTIADDNIDDRLDEIAQQVENVLNTDISLGGVCDNVFFQNTVVGFVPDGTGSDLLACAKLEYEIVYTSFHGINPDTLPDFTSVKTVIKTGVEEIETITNLPSTEE